MARGRMCVASDATAARKNGVAWTGPETIVQTQITRRIV